MIYIDNRSSIPIYEQLVAGLERLIHCHALAPDEKIPSVRELSTQLSVNPNTIQKAYGLLEQKGMIYSVKGRGNFVCGDTGHILDARYAELLADIRKSIAEILELGYDQNRLKIQLSDFCQKGEIHND